MTNTFGLKKWLYTGVLLASGTAVLAQQRPTGNRPLTGTAPTGGNPNPTAAAPKPGPKGYKDVITSKAQTTDGLFKVHKVEDRYFFEIADSVFGRDILVMTRVSRSGADLRSPQSMSGYAGDDVNSNVISFERGPNNKVFLINRSFSEVSKDSTQPMYQAVTRSNMQPIAAAFDIKVDRSDSNNVVIDMTDYISGDNDILHFDSRSKQGWRIGGFQGDKSYITGIKSFPINTEIKAVKTYGRSGGSPQGGMMGGGAPSGGTTTLELNTSMVILPKVPMKPRYFDPRVGYFAVGYTDFDANPQGVKQLILTKRWRLEPKPEDVEKYKRGELVEPQKPIVFYIDPATPAKWVPYLIQGVNDWQKAFEKAGFKNAVVAKVAPKSTDDPQWSLDDARHSAIVYKPSSVPNASGPSTADPRSGEILESHVNWYHNVMQLLRNWYLVQAAAVDPRARMMKFDDELMGQLIRFVSSHEVGHTLGLRHNFGSSSTVPVEKLRDKKFVEENGHTPSIMDYARFNYVAQPEDKIGDAGMFPRIGDYDIWAIEWGYKWTEKSVDEETKMLSKLTAEKMKNKRLWFGTETNGDDPRSQNEDLGDNAMKASAYGIKNLQRILPNLPKWTFEENEGYVNLKSMYGEIAGQYGRYMGHVAKNIGGIMETPKMVEQGGVIYEYVPKATQKEAMDFLKKQLFTTPTWLINQDIFAKTGDNALNIINARQDAVLSRLLSLFTMNKLIAAEAAIGANAYTVTEMLADLKSGIWSELTTRQPIDVYRRMLQKTYIAKMKGLIAPPAAPANAGNPMLGMMQGGGNSAADKSDAISVAKGSLKILRSEVKAAIPVTTDRMSRYHLEDVVDRINEILDPK